MKAAPFFFLLWYGLCVVLVMAFFGISFSDLLPLITQGFSYVQP